MSAAENADLYVQIHDVLYSLGVTEKYVGFFHTSYAVYLTVQQPERLLFITKWLYPDVARRYSTNWRNVERSIRTVIRVAWILRPELLSHIAGYTLGSKPSNTQFISALAAYLQHSDDAIAAAAVTQSLIS